MTPAGPVAARPVRIAQIFVVFALACRLWLSAMAPPIGDEAYYWMWGQRLDWSYFDHPPLHAWLLGLVSLLGWNIVTLRLLTWLTLAGTLWIFWLWAKRLKPEDPGAWWWPTVALYLASPLFFLMSAVSFHDHLLIFLCVATAHAFLVFAEDWENGRRNYGALYGGAVLLGLAVLTKYNGVLLGIGIALFFALHKPVRTAWRSPHLYLAAVLSMAMQAPVILWNVQRSFVSYNFHFSERWGGHIGFRPLLALEFVVLTLLVIGPFLFAAIVRTLRRPGETPFEARARTMALAVFGVSTLVMFAMSFFVEVFFYWNIVAFFMLMPLIAGGFKRRWPFNAHLVYGAILCAGCVLNFSLVPIGNLMGRFDWTISSTFGWPQVAAEIAELKAEHQVAFVATTRYTTAAQLGFAMHDASVVAIDDRHDQYDYWFDPAAHVGENALVVADSRETTKYVERYFDKLEPLDDVPFERFGMVIYRPRIYLATGFHLPPAN